MFVNTFYPFYWQEKNTVSQNYKGVGFNTKESWQKQVELLALMKFIPLPVSCWKIESVSLKDHDFILLSEAMPEMKTCSVTSVCKHLIPNRLKRRLFCHCGTALTCETNTLRSRVIQSVWTLTVHGLFSMAFNNTQKILDVSHKHFTMQHTGLVQVQTYTSSLHII